MSEPQTGTAVHTYVEAALHALAREEAAGRRPLRLLEREQATWTRFRGRLGSAALAELLLEDGAVTHPAAFDAAALLGTLEPLSRLTDAQADAVLAQLARAPLKAPGPDYLQAQAQRLGLPHRFARSELHKLRSHHKVLELPGSGGLIAHHVCHSQEGIYFQDVFTVACATWQERALAGLVALELGVGGALPILDDPTLEEARRRLPSPDYVMGLLPTKGGRFSEEQLRQWFSSKTTELVLV